MSRTRIETVVTINRAWATPEGESEELDIILPQGCTDYSIYDYDSSESLIYVKGGYLYDEHHKKIGEIGKIKEKEFPIC